MHYRQEKQKDKDTIIMNIFFLFIYIDKCIIFMYTLKLHITFFDFLKIIHFRFPKCYFHGQKAYQHTLIAFVWISHYAIHNTRCCYQPLKATTNATSVTATSVLSSIIKTTSRKTSAKNSFKIDSVDTIYIMAEKTLQSAT